MAPTGWTKEQKCRLFLKTIPYNIIDNKLYKRGADHITCRYLQPKETITVLEEMHDQPGDNHFGAEVTIK